MRTIIFFAVLVCFSMPSYSSANNLETCLSGKFPTLCKRNLLTADQLVQVKNAEQAENLKICMKGNFPTLCKRNLLTEDQLMQVKNAEHYINENSKGFVSGLGSNLGQVVMSVGGGDMMNLATGHYIMDMGGGDKMNLGTGDYIMDMGGGDMMNLATGAMTFSFD